MIPLVETDGSIMDDAASDAMTIVLLGEIAVLRHDIVLQPRTRKVRALLALLALEPAGISRGRVGALLWGDRGEEQTRASVRQAVYELRALLGAGAVTATAERIELAPQIAIDAKRLAEVGDLLAMLDATPAVLLQGVDDLSPEFDDWLRDARARLTAELTGWICDVAVAALSSDSAERARRLALHALRFDPFDERAVRIAMRADVALGEQAGSLRRYRDFAARLAAELDAEPAVETQALHARLRDRPAEVSPFPPSTHLTDMEPPRWQRWLFPGVMLFAVLLVASLAGWRHWSTVAASKPVIAVLPFEDISPAANLYFAGGVAEEIQNLLAHAPRMEVLGRFSASQVRRSGDVLAAARKLGVTHLLDGSVRSEPGRVRVIVRLVRVDDGAQLWSERYDRRLGDMLAVQGDIATAVMRRFALPVPGPMPIAPSPIVYDHYLAARALMRDRRAMPLAVAERSLRDAIARQPSYAPAHALLAQVLMLEARHPVSYGSLPYDRALGEATREARLAVRLDPGLGEAQAALGLLTFSNASSIPYYARAVALDPQRADFHRWYGQALMAVGRFDAALREFRRAVAIDPLWGLNSEHLIVALANAGRGAEAATVAKRFALLSRDDLAKGEVALALADTEGRLADSYRIAARIAALAPQERHTNFRLASELAALGERTAAARALASDDELGRIALVGSGEALAAATKRVDRRYWDSAANSWGVNDRLINDGHAAVVLQMFDTAFEHGARFRPNEMLDAFEIAPIVVALRQAGRKETATAILARMERQLDRDRRVRPGAPDLAAANAIVAALRGDRERAIVLLEQVAAQAPYRLVRLPFGSVSGQPALRWLAGDPRMRAVDRAVTAYVDGERHKLGWSPLDEEKRQARSI